MTNKFYTFIFVLFISINVSFSSQALAAQTEVNECATVPGQFGGPEWKYCLHRYPDSGDDLLIYFHGSGGSETDWEQGQLEQDMVKTWRSQGISLPTVMSISFGPTWLLAEKNSSPVSGLYDYFLGVVMPTIKSKMIVPIDQTYLMGLSMGGFNASELYLKMPQLFSRVALICPAMSAISPFATPQEVENYIATTGADPQLVDTIVQLAQAFFPTPSDWSKHSPNILVSEKLNATFPPVYLSNGLSDPYGFALGNDLFVKQAQTLGAPITADFYPGKGHCEVDAHDAALGLIPQ